MASKKTRVVEQLWAKVHGSDPPWFVYFSDLEREITAYNKDVPSAQRLSTANLANFMKDVLRGPNASANWPETLKLQRIAARQRFGEGRSFEFVPFEDEQTEPFPDTLMPTSELEPAPLQSLSLPLIARSLGRDTESWIAQVVVELRVLEQHFATGSSLEVSSLSHLETGVKFGGASEIDAIYFAQLDNGAKSAFVTCEVKRKKDAILKQQVESQVRAVAVHALRSSTQVEVIVPTAVKVIDHLGTLFVVEFAPWDVGFAASHDPTGDVLTVSARSLFVASPPVEGIGKRKAHFKGRA